MFASWAVVSLNTDRESSKTVNLSVVLKVVPEVNNSSIGSFRCAFYFKDVITDTNGGTLDETPVSNKFGTNLDMKTEVVGKLGVFGKDKIALSVELEVFTDPGFDCK